MNNLALAFTVSSALLLSGCKTAEEKAEEHFSSAETLYSSGDVDRAAVELRNVLKLNEGHQSGRRLFARVQMERGNTQQAQKQYTRLVEQYPDDIEGLRELSALAVVQRDWENADRYVPRGYKLSPDDLQFQAMQALLDYRSARLDEDEAAIDDAVKEAHRILDVDGNQLPAKDALIDHYLATDQLAKALEQINSALEQEHENLTYHEIKLQALTVMQDMPAIGAHLEEMQSLFPKNVTVRELLLAWYQENGFDQKAEALLRELADQAEPDQQRAANLSVIRFLARSVSRDAALAEIDSLIETSASPLYYQTLRAAVLFDNGDRDTGVSELKTALAAADTADANTLNDSKVSLAGMLAQTDEVSAAKALVAEVLETDAGHVGALQMHAGWLIEENKTSEAIQALRTALDREQDNANTLTLMAQAHQQDGNYTLAGERLALAVEASNNGAEESLRYAQFLVNEDRAESATAILTDALRRDPSNLSLLQSIGQLHLWQSNWTHVGDIVATLENQNEPEYLEAASRLQTSLVLRQRAPEEGIRYLEQLIERGDDSDETFALLVRSYISTGDWDAANQLLEASLKDSPDKNRLRFIQAALHVASGRVQQAEGTYEALLAKNPQELHTILALQNLLRSTDQDERADEVLQRGFESFETPPMELLVARASAFEEDGDYDAAIEIYEGLYARDPSNIGAANNLASLLSSRRSDPESLSRAAVVAAPLRGTNTPALQDTYGWIQYRLGNYEEALSYLAPAAQALENHATVALHLGLTYAALGQNDLAEALLTQALLEPDNLPEAAANEAKAVVARIGELEKEASDSE